MLLQLGFFGRHDSSFLNHFLNPALRPPNPNGMLFFFKKKNDDGGGRVFLPSAPNIYFFPFSVDFKCKLYNTRLEHCASAERVKHRRVAQYAAPHPLSVAAASSSFEPPSLHTPPRFQYVLRQGKTSESGGR